MIPPSVLRQLYVQGSLTNVEGGLAFRLRNNLAPATVLGMEISVDGEPAGDFEVRSGGRTIGAGELGSGTLTFRVRDEAEIFVRGRTLAPGRHRVELKVRTKEWGVLAFDFEDETK